MKHPVAPDDFLPLRSVELHVLLGIADQPRHGYAILQAADARTDGRPGFEIPTLYRALRRMRDQGLIRAARAPANNDPRSEFWAVTALGRRVLDAELKRLEALLADWRARHPVAVEGT